MLNLTSHLPEDFVYLEEVDLSIKQSIMYYTERNFVGKQVNGYKVCRAILTKQAALELQKLQQDIINDGYSLVVYDAYRPQKAVQHFIGWGKDDSDQRMKEFYYPRINKEDIFKLGYVATESAHSRGSTVDLTIIECDKKLNLEPIYTIRALKDGSSIPYFDDNTVDMGSSVAL